MEPRGITGGEGQDIYKKGKEKQNTRNLFEQKGKIMSDVVGEP
jgi:hypothetical protein